MSPSRVNIERDEAKDDVITINQVIESLSKSGHSFQTLNLHLGSYSDVAAFAVCTKGVHGELHLDFSGHNQFPLPPNSSFSLILDQISSLCRPSFSYIKILHLRSVSHLVGGMVSDLCSSCSTLESLKLEKCDGLESVEVKYFGKSSLIKNLEIADCANIVGIVVSADSLNSFSYKGVFPLVQLLNVPNLVDVALDFGGGLGRNSFDCEDALSLLSSIKDIEILTVSSWFVEAFCCGGVIFNKLDFQFSKLKELKLICSKISSKTRDSCACFLHITPSLEELFLKIDYNSRCVMHPFTHHHWHEPHLWKDYATVKKEAIRLKYVKKIRIMGFTMERDELLWMDLLLHNAINLKEMILDDLWRVARIPYAHLTYLKFKYFLIPCHDIDSFFVLIAH